MTNRRRPHRRCKLYVGMQCDFANHCDAVIGVTARGHRVLVRRCSHYLSAKKFRRRRVHGTRAG